MLPGASVEDDRNHKTVTIPGPTRTCVLAETRPISLGVSPALGIHLSGDVGGFSKDCWSKLGRRVDENS